MKSCWQCINPAENRCIKCQKPLCNVCYEKFNGLCDFCDYQKQKKKEK